MMSDANENTRLLIRDLVIANHNLGHEGVVDAFGHVSVRHPGNPDRYFLSRSRSPELIEASDILEFDLDSNCSDLRGHRPYAERFIHGSVYKARPDVHGRVPQLHAYDLVQPFTVTRVKTHKIHQTTAATRQTDARKFLVESIIARGNSPGSL